jgi:hypothetical protein
MMSKPSSVAGAPEPVVLIIADISGYTRYMTANAKTLAHSQTIITELVHAIIKQIELPLEVAKLEGDAVFLYCRKEQGSLSWPEAKRIIGGKLLTFFRMFSEKVHELSQSATCSCNACTHIEKLRLKIVVHSGEALFHRVVNFLELAGVDVIIVHRLLKNSIKGDQYLLLTDAARHDLEFPEQIRLSKSAESYEDIGTLNTLVYLPEGDQEDERSSTPSFTHRFGKSWKLFCKLWFGPFTSHPTSFRHLPSNASKTGRIGFAILTGLLTPVFLPVGIIFVFFHALKPSKTPNVSDGKKHKPDGSCCQEHSLSE